MFFGVGSDDKFVGWDVHKVADVRFGEEELLGVQNLHNFEDYLLDNPLWASDRMHLLCSLDVPAKA